jgi:hypothetical protein
MDEATPSQPHIPSWRAHEGPYLLLNLSQETMPASPPFQYFSYRPIYQIASTFGIRLYSKNNEIRKRSLSEHRKSTLLTS